MAPQWMPQNLQKRLLLYVLQQLSLFSEIDISNLDVSLGSNSQVTLTDVLLDTDAFQIPGIFLRDGKVKTLQLQLNVSGGVTMDIDEFNLTVALGTASDYQSTEKSKFSLSQSKMDLANSIIQDEDVGFQSAFQSSDDGSLDNSQNDQQTSPLNNVMTKAVELALARLNVNVKNTSLRLIMDQATIDFKISDITFAIVDGVRTINVRDIFIIAIDPSPNPGEVGHQSDDLHNDVEQDVHDDNVSDQSDDNDDDDDYDSDDNKMFTSSILEKNTDLNESLVYSKEEASSIYMSAASDVFRSKKEQLTVQTSLGYINHLNIKFQGLSKVEDITVEVDQVRLSAVPIPLTLLHVIESLSINKSKGTKYTNRSSNINHKLSSVKNAHESQNSLNFKSLTINTFEINLVSALLSDGTFAKPDSLRLIGSGIELKTISQSLIHGGIRSIRGLDSVKNEVLTFSKDDTMKDLRFELNSAKSEFTLLLPKDIESTLNSSQLQSILNLFSFSSQIQDSLYKLNANSHNGNSGKFKVVAQTSLIKLSLFLSDDVVAKLKVSPIAFDSNSSSLKANDLILSTVVKNKELKLLTARNIKWQGYSTERQIKTYDNSGHSTVLVTASSLSIENVDIDHNFETLKLIGVVLGAFTKSLSIPKEDIVFKSRKKARISSNLMYQSRQAIDGFVELKHIKVNISDVTKEFGGISSEIDDITFFSSKDENFQVHAMKAHIRRLADDLIEPFIDIINPDDKSAPVISFKTKDFRDISLFLRNVSIDYYTKWLSILDSHPEEVPRDELGNSSSEIMVTSESESSEGGALSFKFKLSDIAIGLNPGRLSSKALLVISNGNFDLSLDRSTSVRADLRSPDLLLIDDVKNVLSHDDSKKKRVVRAVWTQASYYTAKGFVSVGRSKAINLKIDVIPSIDNKGDSSKPIIMDIGLDQLDLKLCADSSQCLIQVINDLKQAITVTSDTKYRVNLDSDIKNIFDEILEHAFNGENIADDGSTSNSNNVLSGGDTALNIVDGYYEGDGANPKRQGIDGDEANSDILDKDLSELTLRDKSLDRNPFFSGTDNESVSIDKSNSSDTAGDSKSEVSDSIILFNDGHFEEHSKLKSNSSNTALPMRLRLRVNNATLKIYDGYDWKYTRKTISNAVKRLERKLNDQHHQEISSLRRAQESEDQHLIGETLFDSIHVAVPKNFTEENNLISKINSDIQSQQEDTIDVGKNNVKKLKLSRSKFHKLLVTLNEIDVKFTVFTNRDPATDQNLETVTETFSDDFDLVNELELEVSDFEVIDNVPTSTWNKFVTLLKDVERESNSSMLKLNMKTVRPIVSLTATELIINVEILPLRLHVDQDALEVLTRFGEFKDSRFLLIDEFEEIPYIQKFHLNAVRIKLDYKPKKVDYAGLRSGHTTEFMNFFILDEASMVLKQVTLYGVSGFPKLGILLNGLWMPDIKSTQLSGVLSGLAPVRSIVQIGSGFKDLVAVPITEYKKDGRLYRSLSKGVQQFTRNTTYELLKFGVKLAAGTQTFLENTEEALGGIGSSARLPVIRENSDQASEDQGDDSSDDETYGRSQLIGRSSLSKQQPLNRSVYQPTLESIVDIREEEPSTTYRGARKQKLVRQRFENDEEYGFIDTDQDDEEQRTISLYANQPSSLKEGLLLAYDSLGRNFLVAKDAIFNAGTEIGESGSAHDTTLAVVKATPVVLIRPIIGATEAASKALLGINNQLDSSKRKYHEDKHKQLKK